MVLLFICPVWQYYRILFSVRHIKSVDGYSGCYAGLGPKLTGNLLSVVVSQRIADYIKGPQDDEEDDYEDEISEEEM